MNYLSISQVVAAIRQRPEQVNPFFIALDGRSGVGKSTTARELATKLGDAIVIDQDDFYSGGTFKEWSKWTVQEAADRTIDWHRLKKDALLPLRAGKSARWHAFDWDNDMLSTDVTVTPSAKYIIIDGTYSSHDELADLIDIAVLVHVDDKLRRERLQQREGEPLTSGWYRIWEAAEEYYFTMVRSVDSFEFVIDNTSTKDAR